jgi:hypothetical protein
VYDVLFEFFMLVCQIGTASPVHTVTSTTMDTPPPHLSLTPRSTSGTHTPQPAMRSATTTPATVTPKAPWRPAMRPVATSHQSQTTKPISTTIVEPSAPLSQHELFSLAHGDTTLHPIDIITAPPPVTATTLEITEGLDAYMARLAQEHQVCMFVLVLTVTGL